MLADSDALVDAGLWRRQPPILTHLLMLTSEALVEADSRGACAFSTPEALVDADSDALVDADL